MKKYSKIHNMLHSADLLERRLDVLLSPLDVRPRQARVLNVLNRIGAVTQSALAEEIGVTAGSMSTMVKRLTATGLILRQKSTEDARADILSLTDAGRDALIEVRDVWNEMDAEIENALGHEKANLLAALTHELKTALGGSVAGAGWRQRDTKNAHGLAKKDTKL